MRRLTPIVLSLTAVSQSTYYVKDRHGKVIGPYTGAELQRLAREGIVPPDCFVSGDGQRWVPATKVRNLFAGVDQVLSGVAKKEDRDNQQTSLFLDFFVRNENFKSAAHLVQQIRLWWGRLTAPTEFVVAQVSKQGVRYTQHDLQKGTSSPIAEADAVHRIDRGVESNNYKTAAIALSLVWSGIGLVSGGWSVINGEPAALLGLSVGVVIAVISFLGFLHESHRQVFVGYVLDAHTTRRLQHAERLMAQLRQCGGVWTFLVERKFGSRWQPAWKYNAGDSFSVSRLPVVVFRRNLPNVQTNISVPGIACAGMAVYFLPNRLLLLADGATRWLNYSEVVTSRNVLAFVELRGKTYHDSRVLEWRWRYINKDGSRDRRFKGNYQLPRVECGILKLDLGREGVMEMLSSNPDLPSRFIGEFRQLVAGT
jgi:hypothetical protein